VEDLGFFAGVCGNIFECKSLALGEMSVFGKPELQHRLLSVYFQLL
jgi:hypothetical protein